MSPVGKMMLRQCIKLISICPYIKSGSCKYFSTSSYRMYDKTRYSPEYYSYKEDLDTRRCYNYLLFLSEAEKKRLQFLQMEYEIMKASGEYEVCVQSTQF